MISYLYLIGECWLSSAAKAIHFLSETLFLSGQERRRNRAMSSTTKGFHAEEPEIGLGSVRFTRGFGRKRILLSNRVSSVQIPATESPPVVKSSLKRQRNRANFSSSSSERKSRLESLPQDLLIRVICCVDHDDLQSLSLVSKPIRESSLIAKRLHFAYTTPKKIRAFRDPLDQEEVSGSNEDGYIEPPNAPVRHRLNEAKRKEQLASVSVALFK